VYLNVRASAGSELIVPTGGYSNRHFIELGGIATRVKGSDPLTNSAGGELRGTGRVEVEFTNDAAAQVNAVNDTLVFTQLVDNLAGGQINAINSTLDFQAGLANGGQLNLINTTILGDVTGISSGAARFAGENSVSGDLSMSAGDSLAIHFGGTTTGQFDSLAVGGDAALAGALSVSLTGGFTLAPSQVFTIVDVAGTTFGSFDSLAEGDLVGAFGGTNLFITYQGGDGNDVELFTPGYAADFDEDTDVDGDDFDVWKEGFAIGDTHDEGDADEDLDVDGADFLAWQQQFGSPPPATPAAHAVPEPSAHAHAAVVSALIVVVRRRLPGSGGQLSPADGYRVSQGAQYTARV
jgi:hypothetical protein